MEGDAPKLDDHGLLPPGIHDVTLDQLQDLFGRFQTTDRRPNLFRKLREYLEELRRTGWKAEVIVNGSFVMGSVDEPEDIDLLVVLPEGWDVSADLRPFEYNVLSKRRTRRKFGFDVFVVTRNSDDEQKMRSFFEGIAVKWLEPLGFPQGSTKGLLRIRL